MLCFRRKTDMHEFTGDQKKDEKALRKIEKYHRERTLTPPAAAPSTASAPSTAPSTAAPSGRRPIVPEFNGTNHNQVAIALAKLQEYYRKQTEQSSSQEREYQRRVQLKKDLELREKRRQLDKQVKPPYIGNSGNSGDSSNSSNSGKSKSSSLFIPGFTGFLVKEDHNILATTCAAMCLSQGSLPPAAAEWAIN